MQKVALVQERSSTSAPGCIGVGAGINDHDRPVGAALAFSAPTMGSALARVRHPAPIAAAAMILNARNTATPSRSALERLTYRQVEAIAASKSYCRIHISEFLVGGSSVAAGKVKTIHRSRSDMWQSAAGIWTDGAF